MRSHIERFGGIVEYGTELRSFEQHADRVDATLVTKIGETEKTETVACHYLVGSDGAKGMLTYILIRFMLMRSLVGVVRKQLGLSFVGKTDPGTQVLIGLVEVHGLGTTVRRNPRSRKCGRCYLTTTHLQQWHQWGDVWNHG